MRTLPKDSASYRAAIYGASVCVLGVPAYLEHVLLKNWKRYVKGRAIKRIAFALCVLAPGQDNYQRYRWEHRLLERRFGVEAPMRPERCDS